MAAALAALALLLVLLQTVGAMHRVAHGGAGTSRVAAAVAAAGSAEPGWVEHLFGGHAGDHDCGAFDQASHGDAAPAVATVVAVGPAPVSSPPVFHAGWQLAEQARGRLARGPPPAA